jgi:hypothetical protein
MVSPPRGKHDIQDDQIGLFPASRLYAIIRVNGGNHFIPFLGEFEPQQFYYIRVIINDQNFAHIECLFLRFVYSCRSFTSCRLLAFITTARNNP